MHSLYLFPVDPACSPPPLRDVKKCLNRLELLGDTLDENQFLVGKGFFQHVSFAGCSPAMQLTPTADPGDPFVHIKLLGPFPTARLYTSSQYSKPRCPACRARLPNEQTGNDPVHCPACKMDAAATALLWRNYAAWGRMLIEIPNIFPGEALPSETWLAALASDTGLVWQHGWAESSA